MSNVVANNEPVVFLEQKFIGMSMSVAVPINIDLRNDPSVQSLRKIDFATFDVYLHINNIKDIASLECILITDKYGVERKVSIPSDLLMGGCGVQVRVENSLIKSIVIAIQASFGVNMDITLSGRYDLSIIYEDKSDKGSTKSSSKKIKPKQNKNIRG